MASMSFFKINRAGDPANLAAVDRNEKEAEIYQPVQTLRGATFDACGHILNETSDHC